MIEETISKLYGARCDKCGKKHGVNYSEEYQIEESLDNAGWEYKILFEDGFLLKRLFCTTCASRWRTCGHCMGAGFIIDIKQEFELGGKYESCLYELKDRSRECQACSGIGLVELRK
jgi:hypothetical protein